MKTLKGNGVDSTFFKGAINPGSALTIESASIQDVNVYGGTLSIQGGVVLDGTATTSGTAAVAFTGGTFGTGGYVSGTAFISSAVLGDTHIFPTGQTASYIGSGGSMLDMNQHGFTLGTTCHVDISGVIFSGGSVTNTGLIRISSGTTAHFSDCVIAGGTVNTNGIVYQNGNTTSSYFDNCTFSGNRTPTASNNVGIYKANNGLMQFTSCTFIEHAARSLPVLYNFNGGLFVMSKCTVTSCSMTVNGTLCQTIGTSAHFESCVFSSNSSTEKNKNGRVFILGATVTMIDCIVDQIISSPTAAIYTSATCKYTISGGAYSTIQNLGTTTLAGNLTFTYFSSGTVNITSGTSIALTSNMSCTAINVDGGCTVNGAVVSAGTYTNIDSTGKAT